jgi:prephenate dehydrogenase
MQKMGIIGAGNFTKFITPILQKYFIVEIFDRADIEAISKGEGKNFEGLNYLIFSVPLGSIEEVCKKIQYKVPTDTVLVDVTSVKVQPLKVLQQYFLENQILGTHPIFGPQSGKNGIEGLPIVLSNVNLDKEKYSNVKNFFSDFLKLNVIEKTPNQHDREMAYVQGLSHFIGRALSIFDVDYFDTATKSYKQLVHLKELLQNDSWELYKTIQNGNPYTKEIRLKFLKILEDLEQKLESEE